MSIAFDEAVANRFIHDLRAAAELLARQGWDRMNARDDALEDFTGGHAELFMELFLVESADRSRLAGALEDLADQVRAAKDRAQEEHERILTLAAWQERENERVAERASAPTGLPLHGYEVYDVKPSTPPVAPPALDSSFAARPRSRTVGAVDYTGVTSADPERLRDWVERVRNRIRDARDERLTLRDSFDRFRAECSWVRSTEVSVFDGYEDYLFECDDDAKWVERIAQAFEDAGSGRLTDLALTLGTATATEAFPLITDAKLTPEQVALAWAALEQNPHVDTDALLKRYAQQLGQLDGLPALVRVQANRYRVPALLSLVKRELEQVRSGDLDGGEERVRFLRHELAYLSRALLPVDEGGVQLYLYDRAGSRIVEMLGTPGPETVRSVTYVPGTFTGLDSFYTGAVQQIGRHLVSNLPDTVAFVYKDGIFPGEERASAGSNPIRIMEANDQDLARTAGARLAGFGEGIRADPALNSVSRIGIGHSWGLANLTSSEVAGAEYDTVISLSGAGMLPDWKPGRRTGYFDLSYNDILQAAQRDGRVWDGNFPRNNRGFTSLPYYEGPEDDELRGKSLLDTYDVLRVATKNHSLIAQDTEANKKALQDLVKLVKA